MELKCTPQELKELLLKETPVTETTCLINGNNILSGRIDCNESKKFDKVDKK